ncbi:MAG: multiheme c-type cytochrome [Methylocella sp.]
MKFCWVTLFRLALFGCALLAAPAFADEQTKRAEAAFVGAVACAGCHAAETQSWSGSHHAEAMRKATPATVLGDFNDATLNHHGVTTTFSRSGDAFMVRTEGPDGTLRDYEIAYAFGVYPLQQYLIAFPGGRYQALGFAWDSRPKDQGGQRWMHLYPNETLAPGSPLHWTGRDQTWNYQCAACHSTDLKKNYDLGANAYATTWSDVNVSCEACHGPGSRHVDWAKRAAGGAAPNAADDPHLGLTTWLTAPAKDVWRMNPDTGIAQRTAPADGRELDICAPCHARRKIIARDAPVGAPFLDAALPALLEPGLYHADGQIDGEVFEYGSFLQSRMRHAGVTCSDCHEPHSLALRAQGNALCAQCHLPAKFDVAAHTHHEPGSVGAQCVNCHMPAKTYMIVHERRDHSLRVPRPDLTLAIGTPNACAACHADKGPEWAARLVAEWFPGGRQTQGHYGLALNAGRTGAADAEQRLDQLIADASQPAIARASALALLAPYASPRSQTAIEAALKDRDPLVRAAAPRALPAAPPPAMVEAFAPLLSDPIRAVRVEVARALAGADQSAMTDEQRTALAAAYLELVDAEMTDADRPEAHLNLGLFDMRRGQGAEAEAEYQTALRLDPAFAPALVNLADLDRARGADEAGAELLRKAVALEPDNADAHHSLGLSLVRRRNYAGALAELRKASELAPDNARYAYVYAIALNTIGGHPQAMALLEETHRRHPTDRDILLALVSIARETGDGATALLHARELAALYPADMQLRLLVRQLEQGPPQ